MVDFVMLSTQKEPRAFRPKRALFIAAYPVISSDAYVAMSKVEFTAAVMKNAGGSLNPSTIGNLYAELMDEAGLPIR